MKKVFNLLLPLFFISIITSAQTVTFIGVANNSTDNTAALNAAFQQGSTVNIPSGSNYYKIAGTVNIPAGKTIVFASGAKFNVTGNLSGNNTTINAGESEIFKNTSNINGTWTTSYIYAKWTGAVGNGTTDDYASLNLFFKLLGKTDNTEARLGVNKQYYIKNEIIQDVTKEINLDGRGSRIFRKYADLSSNEYIVKLDGVISVEKTITTNLVKGQLTIRVNNNSGLSNNMGVEILSNELYGQEDMGGGNWHYHYKGLMSKINSISGNNITLKDTIPFDFNSSDVWAVRFFTVIPVTIKNLEFSAENITGTRHINNFALSQLFDVELNNITCNPLGYLGISTNSIYNGSFKNITCIEPASGGDNYHHGVYGIVPQLNVNCTYENVHVQSVTHGIAFTNEPSYNVLVKDSYFKASWYQSNAVDSHASHWVKFENDTIYGAQGNWGTFIFENCEMHEVYNGLHDIWNEREGASRGNLEVYFNNCNFYTLDNGNSVTSIIYRQHSLGATTNKYSILNSNFYLENNASYLTNAVSPGSAVTIKPFRVEGNSFYGNGTLCLPKEYNSTPTTQGGVFTFKNNNYSLVYWSNPPLDQFQTIDIINNSPVNTNTSDFWVNWEGPAGNINFKYNHFVGTCFWIKDCTGNILFDDNDIYNDQLKSGSSYKNRNYITGNINLDFVNNNLHTTFWTITGNKTVSNNVYNGLTQPDEPIGSWANINTPGSSIETGITMEGITNYTIISRAKMDDLSTDALQNLVGSSAVKLYLGFNPSGPSPYFKSTIRNVDGTVVRPAIGKFYMDNQWHTYVFIMQNGILKAYMDGIAMLSYDASDVYNKMYATGTIQIGGVNSTELWSGPIQTFAIYNRALSLTEANSFAENPNTSISGEIYKLAVSNGAPVGHWKFDETSGTTASDNSGNNFNGTLINGPIWTTGINSNAIQFDGVNDRIDCGADAGMDMGTGDFSVSAWVKMGSSQLSYPTILSKGGTSSTNAGYWFYISGSNIKFAFGDGTQRLSTNSGTVNIFDDTWHHIAVAVDRDGDATFYVDGLSAGTYDVSSYNGKNISNPTQSLKIGSTGGSTSCLNGKIDDVKIFSKVLNQTEIDELIEINFGPPVQSDYISYWALDESSGINAADFGSNEYDGTLLNGPFWSSGINNNALQFDGVNDFVDCGAGAGLDMGTDDWSVAAWVNLGSNQNSYPTILAKGATSITNAGYWFYISGSRLKFSISDGSQRISTYSEIVNVLDDTWHHIAVTVNRDGDAVFYFDGINAGNFDVSSFNGKNITNPARLFTFGSTGASTTFINGKLDELQIYRRVLTSNDVAGLANNSQSYNLVSHWAFDESNGSIAVDSSTYLQNDGTLTNGPLRKSGIKGNALEFDGVNDKVECGSDTAMDMGIGDFTISSWVKMGSNQLNYPTIVSKGGTSSSNAGYWFYLSGQKIKFNFSDGTERLSTYSDVVNIMDNLWHHIAVVVDRDGEAVFYLDGLNTGVYDVSTFSGKDIINPDKLLTIGSASSSSTTFLNGKIDDVKIFNSALSQSEITALAYVPQNNSILLGTGEENQGFHFINAFPNPFRDKLTLRISSTKDQKVSAYIYDMNGIAIKKYDNKTLTVGVNELYWDGRNDNGAFVNPGMYFVRVITNSKVDNLTIIKMQ